MATKQLIPAPERADHQASAMSAADVLAHELASYVRRPRPVAADEHGKTKDPLPQRPRGPHPVGTVS